MLFNLAMPSWILINTTMEVLDPNPNKFTLCLSLLFIYYSFLVGPHRPTYYNYHRFHFFRPNLAHSPSQTPSSSSSSSSSQKQLTGRRRRLKQRLPSSLFLNNGGTVSTRKISSSFHMIINLFFFFLLCILCGVYFIIPFL